MLRLRATFVKNCKTKQKDWEKNLHSLAQSLELWVYAARDPVAISWIWLDKNQMFD